MIVVFNILLFLFWQMEQLGIYSRLDQVFQAPDTVKDVLISQAGLDDSVLLYYLSSVHKLLPSCIGYCPSSY
jgi:hypothetical protein